MRSRQSDDRRPLTKRYRRQKRALPTRHWHLARPEQTAGSGSTVAANTVAVGV